MIRVSILSATLLLAGTSLALSAEKETVCRINGEVMAAVQQARLDRVPQNKLTETVAAARPDLSPEVLKTVPNIGNFVYDMRRRDLRKVDLGAAAEQQCLDNWEQIQALKNGS